MHTSSYHIENEVKEAQDLIELMIVVESGHCYIYQQNKALKWNESDIVALTNGKPVEVIARTKENPLLWERLCYQKKQSQLVVLRNGQKAAKITCQKQEKNTH